jgi:fructosamine-3-kinase
MSVDEIRDAIAEATGDRPEDAPQPIGGGCINETFRLGDYFVKSNRAEEFDMFAAEREGLLELRAPNAIRLPAPVCSGRGSSQAFLVLEYLPLESSSSCQEALGHQLAELHRATSQNHGWSRDNYIGATPQPNQTSPSWIEFFGQRRLGHMLTLAEARGYRFKNATTLLDKLGDLFDGEPSPSLLHGDLWGGNAAALPSGIPVIFDPAIYYGDREADLAMTRLFGGFSAPFYQAYEESWPLPVGHERRVNLYNLYHILNHAVLFGGGYARQAQGMIDQLL